MKSILITCYLLLFAFATISAQYDEEPVKSGKIKSLYFGIGLGDGFFYPNEINDYLKDYYSSGETVKLFTSYYCIQANISCFPTKYTEIAFETQYAFNTTTGNNSEDVFFLSRLTPVFKFNFHLPFSQKASYFLGSGLNYNKIVFDTPDKRFEENTFGVSFETGFLIRIKKIALKPGLAFNIIKANNTNDSNNGMNNYPSEFSFTGANIFFNFQF